MRWIRYTAKGNTAPAYGILEGDRIIEVAGTPFGAFDKTQRTHKLGDVRIELPVVPPTFYAVGFNYTDHIMKVAARTGQSPNLPTQPDGPLEAYTNFMATSAGEHYNDLGDKALEAAILSAIAAMKP